MKALTKDRFLVMINILYKNDEDVIYEDSLKNHMKTYGDDYYISHDYEWELVNKNKNWKECE